MKRMTQWFLRFSTIIGVIVCVTILLGVLAGTVRCFTGGTVLRHSVLVLDLEKPVLDTPGVDPLARLLLNDTVSVRDVVEALERARNDERVVGLVATIGGTNHGMATVQELRDAVERFRSSGKFAVAFSQTFGEFNAGNQGYYLATAFDQIWLQPSGDVGLTGLVAEGMFFRGTLDLLDIEFQGDHRKEYKSALNMFKERHFTPAHRESTQAVMDAMFGQMVRAIAERRGVSEGEVRKLVDAGPHSAKDAQRLKLVDTLGYHDQMWATVEDRVGEKPRRLGLATYLDRAGRPHAKGKKVALIYGIGQVTRGESSFDPLGGDQSMGADTVTRAFRSAIANENIAAILFRVDSPGGSYVASDAIWREVVRAREAGKPVIVSMGNVAGSGGYFVAMPATKIVAHPGTITGSIGVLGGKPVLRDLLNRVGLTFDEVHTSRNATMWSTLHEYDSVAWAKFQTWLDQVYADFTSKAAKGRNLSPQRIEAVAKGRIWSGEHALANGLVDALGGYAVALDLVREQLELDADAELELVQLPKPRSLLDLALGDESDATGAAVTLRGLVEPWQPLLQALRAAGLVSSDSGVLYAPPMTVGP